MNFEDVIVTEEMIRAGATHPSAVSSSYYQPCGNLSHSGTRRKEIVSTSNRNTRLRPAFGGTRDEGAVGPIKSLSPYADAVDCNRRIPKPAYLKSIASGRETAAPQRQQHRRTSETVAKGPTAETVISMVAAGRKPPVPESGQIEKHKKTLSKISMDLATAVSRQNDGGKLLEAVSFDVKNTDAIRSDKVPGYRQTWGVAFSQENFQPLVRPAGPGGAKYSQDYPPGVIHLQ